MFNASLYDAICAIKPINKFAIDETRLDVISANEMAVPLICLSEKNSKFFSNATSHTT